MNKKQLKRQRVENWLLANRKFLNIKAIERQIKIPENTIQRFTKNGIKLTSRRITLFDKWLTKLLLLADEDWIIENSKYLNISAIERKIKVSKGVVQKYTKYRRKLNNQTLISLEKWQSELLQPIEDWRQSRSHKG